MKKIRLLTIAVCAVVGLGFMAAPISFNAVEGGLTVSEAWAASDKAKKDKKEKKEKKAKKDKKDKKEKKEKKDKSCTRDQPCNDDNQNRKKK